MWGKKLRSYGSFNFNNCTLRCITALVRVPTPQNELLVIYYVRPDQYKNFKVSFAKIRQRIKKWRLKPLFIWAATAEMPLSTFFKSSKKFFAQKLDLD